MSATWLFAWRSWRWLSHALPPRDGAVDVKGIGSPATPALVTQNTTACGFNEKLSGYERSSYNPTPAFYTENVYSPDETLTYSLNVAYDSGAGFQHCPGGRANNSGCGMDVKYYNNDGYIGSSAPSSFFEFTPVQAVTEPL